MDALHPTIRAMLASAPRGRLELSAIGRWSHNLRTATGADAVVLMVPAEMRTGWIALYETGAGRDFDGSWLVPLRTLGVDLDLPLTTRRLVSGDDLLRAEHTEFVHATCGPQRQLVIPMATGSGTSGYAIAVGAEARHHRRFEAAVSAVAGDIAAALAHQRVREEMLRDTLRSLPVATFVVGADLRIRLASAAAVDLLRLGQDGTSLGDLQAATGLALADLVRSASRGGARVSSDCDGPQGPLRVDAVGLPDAQAGDAPGPVLVSVADQSERRRVARQQNEFLSTVGHELRTPLTSLRTSLELLATTAEGDEAERERLAVMALRNCERLDRLIAELLDTARQRIGEIHLECADAQIAEVLGPVLDEAAHTAHRSGRALDVLVDPSANAWADPVRVAEIVEALLANALKFTPVDGRIELRVRGGVDCPDDSATAFLDCAGLPGGGCEISVEDDGRGMDDTTRSRAFEPFFQDGDPLGDRPAGAGLGLTVVRALAEAHGGEVRLESAPDAGTRVAVWLPASEETARALRALAAMDRAGADAQRGGQGIALDLAGTGAESSADELVRLELPGPRTLRLVRVAADWTPPTAAWHRIGNDGESTGTTLARLLQKSGTVIEA